MTTTPNPTAEQIVSEALNRLPGGSGGFHKGSAHVVNVVHDLRAAGLLAGGPTEEQVEQAAREFERVWDEIINSFDPDLHDAMSRIKAAMHVALTAAGFAPQDPNECGDAYTCADLGHEDCDGGHPLHSKPAISPDRENLIEQLRDWADRDWRFMRNDYARTLRQAAAALAAQSELDLKKVADALCKAMDEESYEGEPCVACRYQAEALCEAAKRGELT